MKITSWLQQFRQSMQSVRRRNATPHNRQPVEALERRTLLTTFTVMNTDNTGPNSLRDAIGQANSQAGADTIVFDASIAGQTITLGSRIDIADDLTIEGGADGMTISGDNRWDIFNIFAPSTTLDSLTLQDAGAEFDGSAIVFGGDDLTIRNSTFQNNTALERGGALLNIGGVVVIENSTIVGNAAPDVGGGLANQASGTLILINSTVANNRSDSDGSGGGFAGGVGGGIWTQAGSTTLLQNSVVAGNFMGTGTAAFDLSGALDAGSTFNLIGDASNAGGLTNGTDNNQVGIDWTTVLSNDGSAPILADNGGPTATVALAADSPTIDAGDNTSASTTDQRGRTRTADSDGNGTATVDIGAFEVPAPLVVMNTANTGAGSLRDVVGQANNQAGADTIVFDSSIAGQTITLGSRIDVSDDLTIEGGTDGMTISGDNRWDIFNIFAPSTTLDSLTLQDAGANFDGSAIYFGGDDLLIRNSTLQNNRALSRGGALFNIGGNTTILNSTIFGNSAPDNGGGLANFNSGTLTIINSTITGNRSDSDDNGSGIGGGIHTDSGSTTILQNSIVAGNFMGTATSLYDLSGAVDGASSFNLIGDAANAGGLTNGTDNNQVGIDWTTVLLNDGSAPILADNGGPTATVALTPTSPATDTGSNAIADGIAFDQRGLGFERILDGNGNGTAVADIGAFEAILTLPEAYQVTTPLDELDFSNSDVSLREAILSANHYSGSQRITFDSSFTSNGPQTLLLTQGQLPTITDSGRIEGPNPSLLTIDANDQSRIFQVNDGSALTDINVIITGLTLTGGTALHGGAVQNSENLSLFWMSFQNNSAPGIPPLEEFQAFIPGYGGALHNDGHLTIIQSLFSGNSASNGAAIYSPGTVTILDSTVAGNAGGGATAAEGNGHTIDASQEIISRNNTITGNTGGSAIAASGPLSVANTIVAGNGSGDISGTVTGLSANNILGTTGNDGGLTNGTNGNQVGVDWKTVVENNGTVANLANNGGLTQTIALLTPGPAIDAGDNASAFGLTRDQRSDPFQRIVDGDGDGTATVDVGAFEAAFVAGSVQVSPTVTGAVEGQTAQYTIALSQTPTAVVSITATADSQTEVSLDGVTFSTSVTLTFTTTTAQTVTIRAIEDFIVEAEHDGEVFHAITSSTDHAYPSDLSIPRVVMGIVDNDVASFEVTAPTGFIQNQRPTVSWTAVEGALSYNLYVNIDDGGGNVFQQQQISSTQTSLTIPQDLEFARYRVFIEANMPGNQVKTQDQGHTFVMEVQADLTPIGATIAPSPQFTWNRVAGASSYVIFINQPGSPVTATVADPGSGSTVSHTITSTLARNDYKWWVRPIRTVGAVPFLGPWSEASEFSTGGRTKVTSPARNSTVDTRTPTFSWPAVPAAQSYEVYVSKVGTPGALYRDAGITGNSVDSRVLDNGDYKIWIRTTQADGSGVWGSGVGFTVNSVTTNLTTTPTGPTTPGFGATPTFTWQSTTGANTYDIYLHNGTSTITQSGLTGTSFTPTTPLAAGAWEWSIRPVNGSGVGTWSAAIPFTTNGLTSLTSPGSSTSDTTPTFAWNTVSGATSYSLQVDNRTTGTGNVIREDGLTVTSFTSATVLAPGSYRAWVRAVSSSSTGPWSFQFDFVVAATEQTREDGNSTRLVSIVNRATDTQLLLAEASPTATEERPGSESTALAIAPRPQGRSSAGDTDHEALVAQFAVISEWMGSI